MLPILDFYIEQRNYSKQISLPLSIEDYNLQPTDFVSPVKWHLAHTTWFFEQFVLIPFDADYQEYDACFRFLFNSYYESLGEKIERNQRGLISRPSVDEIFQYRDYVDKHMIAFLSKNHDDKKVYDTIYLGIQHEQQHQELIFTDLKYSFSLNPFRKYDR